MTTNGNIMFSPSAEGLYDLAFVMAVLLVLFVVAALMVWFKPSSAEYLSGVLWRRACAKTAADEVYKRVWDEQEPDGHVQERAARSAERAMGISATTTDAEEHRGGCMGHA